MVKDNFKLGDFKMTGITRLKAGKVNVKVCLDVDTSGIMHVTAEETTGTVTQSISVNYDKNRLSQEEILKLQ